MKKLLAELEGLRKGRVKEIVGLRIKEFSALGEKPSPELFKELCFCTLTANFDAEKTIALQEIVSDGFLELSEKKLEEQLRKFGYRYPNRASYIVESRKFKDALKGIVFSFSEEKEARQWLAENVKGLGFKEASHFLRNIGFQNLAIVDFHIVDLLERHKLIRKPKTMTKKKYLEIEETLAGIGKKAGMGLAELDLYLWFLETGKVLK